jgi:hypothetical protein
MSHSWLQRKRKGELIELAQKAGLPKYVPGVRLHEIVTDSQSVVQMGT